MWDQNPRISVDDTLHAAIFRREDEVFSKKILGEFGCNKVLDRINAYECPIEGRRNDF